MRNYPDAVNFKLKNFSRRLRVLILTTCWFLLLLAQFNINLSADTGETVTANIVHGAHDKILIGDPLKLKIDVHHRVSNNYQLKIDERGIAIFELRGQPIITTHVIDGQWADTDIELTIVPFRTGKLPLAPLLLTNNNGGNLQTPPLAIDVEALSTPQDQAIKDIRLMPDTPNNGWLRGVIFSILLATAGFYWLMRVVDARLSRWLLAYLATFSAQPNPVVTAPLARASLEDETIGKLRLLLASGLAHSDVKRFHIQLAEILIDYAIARYQAPRQEYTTSELLTWFQSKGVPVLVTSAYQQIMTSCDLVKFARLQPEVESSERSVRQAIDLLKALNLGNKTAENPIRPTDNQNSHQRGRSA